MSDEQGMALDPQEVVDDMAQDFANQYATWMKQKSMLQATVRALTKQRDDALREAREARMGENGDASGTEEASGE